MALRARLDLRQAQAPVMTPQLQQAIKLLQLSNLELANFVEGELERNPLLEHEDANSDGSDGAAEPLDARRGDGEGDAGAPSEWREADGREPTFESGSQLDTDPANLWDDDFQPGAGGGDMAGLAGEGGAFASWGPGGRPDDRAAPADLAADHGASLIDHLTAQLNVDLADPAERIIGRALIEALDDAGYLSVPTETIADRLGCAPSAVDSVLAKLQRFEPTGVFARDLRECFALQLAERDRLDPAMQALLDNLDVLAKHDFHALGRLCGVDQEDLADMVGELKALDPKPGAAFDGQVTQWITPDVLMRAKPGGGWLVELNPDTLPRVLVNRAYHAEVSTKRLSGRDKAYLQESLQSAQWLVKALDQRARTILKVASEIIRQQEAFFLKGIAHLKPLVLNDIAEAVEMHESTVSRVTANKYIATPRGIFELKYFFTNAIGTTVAGEGHSAEAVRHRIRVLIDGESPKNILSDDRIVEILRSDGVDIARRTVAKYRDALHIPSSVQRRRIKQAHISV